MEYDIHDDYLIKPYAQLSVMFCMSILSIFAFVFIERMIPITIVERKSLHTKKSDEGDEKWSTNLKSNPNGIIIREKGKMVNEATIIPQAYQNY